MRLSVLAGLVVMLCLTGCLKARAPYVGNKYKPDHLIEQKGHETRVGKSHVIDYDYWIEGDKLRAKGFVECVEGYDKSVDYAKMKLHFLMLDSNGIVLENFSRKLKTGSFCEVRTFDKTLPYKEEYKGMIVYRYIYYKY